MQSVEFGFQRIAELVPEAGGYDAGAEAKGGGVHVEDLFLGNYVAILFVMIQNQK